MKKSETIKSIAAALATFHKEVNSIKREAVNPFFGKTYATLSNILDVIKAPLEKAGLVFSQLPDGENTLTTVLIHVESGEFFECSYNITPVKNTPQAVGSAITYARRYALGAILGLNIEDDDDGNSATEAPKTPKQITTVKQPENWLAKDSDIYIKAVDKLIHGKTTIAKIKKAYKLRPEVEAELTKHVKK